MMDFWEVVVWYCVWQCQVQSVDGDEDGGILLGIVVVVDCVVFIEIVIQVVICCGEFDDLFGVGKLLEGLGIYYDLDWWICCKIEIENFIGFGFFVILLCIEDCELDDQFDLFGCEFDVWDVVEDFNCWVWEVW